MTVRAHVQMAALKLGHRRLKLQRLALQGRAAAPAPSIPLDIYVTAVWIHLFADCAALPSLCPLQNFINAALAAGAGGHKTASYFYFIPPHWLQNTFKDLPLVSICNIPRRYSG